MQILKVAQKKEKVNKRCQHKNRHIKAKLIKKIKIINLMRLSQNN